MKLDIGGGFSTNVCFPEGETREGFIVVDKFNLNQPGTIQADAWNMHMFADNSVKVIFSSHMLEHMPHAKVLPTLKEWYRVLGTDGRLYLHLPDLEYCVSTWLNAPEDHPEKWGWFIKIIFGGQGYEGDAHLTGFTIPRIESLLETAGFTSFRSTKVWCDVHNQMEIRVSAPVPPKA